MGTTVGSTKPSLGTALRSNPEIQQALLASRERESAMSKILMAFIVSGLLFMLFPGTLLGVWNLLQISGPEHAGRISRAWLQAHGHAQVFGWVGSFLLGIGFYSIPKLRDRASKVIRAAWVCWLLWTIGVAIRWAATVYLWNWRVLVPTGGILELLGFLIFFSVVSQHRPKDSSCGTGRRVPGMLSRHPGRLLRRTACSGEAETVSWPISWDP